MWHCFLGLMLPDVSGGTLRGQVVQQLKKMYHVPPKRRETPNGTTPCSTIPQSLTNLLRKSRISQTEGCLSRWYWRIQHWKHTKSAHSSANWLSTGTTVQQVCCSKSQKHTKSVHSSANWPSTGTDVLQVSCSKSQNPPYEYLCIQTIISSSELLLFNSGVGVRICSWKYKKCGFRHNCISYWCYILHSSSAWQKIAIQCGSIWRSKQTTTM
jgi:hypothetical protein